MSWMLSGGSPAFAPPRCRASAMARLRVDGLGAAAQDGGVAGLEAEHGGVAGDVGTRFVDDADDADGHAHLPQLQAVGPGPFGEDLRRRDRGARPLPRWPAAMASTPFASSRRRSSRGPAVPPSSARFTSCAFAARMDFSFARISAAIARRMAFFCLVVSLTSSRDAARARRPRSRMRSWMDSDISMAEYAAGPRLHKRGAQSSSSCFWLKTSTRCTAKLQMKMTISTSGLAR